MARKTALLLIFTLVLNLFFPYLTQADELDEVTSKLEQIKKEQAQLSSDIDKLGKDLSSAQGQINEVASRVDSTRGEIGKMELALKDRSEKLHKQETVRNLRVRNFYKKIQINPLLTLVGERGFAANAEDIFYEQTALAETKHIIVTLNKEITGFAQNKKELETIKKSQEANLAKLNSLKGALAKQKSTVQSRLTSVENEIKSLSARQQQLLAEKVGSFSTSVGEVPASDDDQHLVNPGFSPAFAAFSFGAPHRVGMSQYGAYGRSKAGQGVEAILGAYYANTHVEKNYPVPANLTVTGYGAIPFEDNYLKGIGEMPGSWGDSGGMEALKAQAIASRSYALSVTTNGAGSICPTEACQVYLGHNKGGNWEQAVIATRNWVLVDNSTGQPITAWYASTAGGITRSSADVFGSARSYAQGNIDTETGTIATWPGGAYEGSKYGRSPWFYKAWYKPRGAAGSRPHAWLTSEEMADIINCALLYSSDPGTAVHLSQLDKPNPDTWTASQVRDQLSGRGISPASSVTAVGAANYNQVGYTGSVSFTTNTGTKTINGTDFKAVFNLRAPGEIYLASSLYNVESK